MDTFDARQPKGQLTVIAGKKGEVWIDWHEEGRELSVLDALKNEWRGDAQVALVVMLTRDQALLTLSGLSDYLLYGRMYDRGAMALVLQDVVNFVEAADELEEEA